MRSSTKAITTAAMALGAALLAARGAAQEPSFYQLDLILDGVHHPATDWGEADIVVPAIPLDEVRYVNMAINGTWQVVNVPVTREEEPPTQHVLTVDFDLGNPVGTAVSAVTYSMQITASPLASMPTGGAPAPVATRSLALFSGFHGASVALMPAEPMIGGPIAPGDATFGVNAGVPNQPCGPSECVPAAVSNSLRYLVAKHGLALTENQTSIETMKVATAWSNGCTQSFWVSKAAYMSSHGYPITTTATLDVDEAIDALRQHCDVEIVGDNHAAAVTSIFKLSDGRVQIRVHHDASQTAPHETITDTTYLNPTYNALTGGKWFTGTSLRNFIIECPVLPECYLFLGLHEGYLPLGPEPDDVLLLSPLVIYPVTTVSIPSLSIPNQSSLVAMTLAAQVGMFNPVAFPANPLQMSNGWRLTIAIGTDSYGQNSGIVLTGDPMPMLGHDYNFSFVIQ